MNKKGLPRSLSFDSLSHDGGGDSTKIVKSVARYFFEEIFIENYN